QHVRRAERLADGRQGRLTLAGERVKFRVRSRVTLALRASILGLMKSFIRFAGAAVAGLVLAGSLAQAAHADVRNPLLPPIGNLPFLAAYASGTQNYACNGTAWPVTGPRVNLFDRPCRVIITHFGGQTWQATYGTKVVGTLA